MNIVDVFIVLLLISSLYRGSEIGFVRQFFSTAGFFGGLFLGAYLQRFTVHLGDSDLSKSLITLMTTLGFAFLFMALGEQAGIWAKRKLQQESAQKIDTRFGAVLASISLLLIVWLSANIFASLPSPPLQEYIQNSRIVSTLNDQLPPAPTVIAGLSRLIDPNGFPQVFTGREPTPDTIDISPSLDGFGNAIASTKKSVVKLEGQGCGGIVDGSGFIVGPGLVATNAHVVAGIRTPYVVDTNGAHRATAIWFDANLDFAILRTTGLAGETLEFNTTYQARGTNAAILGYPGGGALQADSAAILDQFVATGRNIYGEGVTNRDIYEVQADIIPGNSGGPMIDKSGKVIGVVFAESTTYENVGYTLTAKKVLAEVQHARGRTEQVSTGSCAE